MVRYATLPVADTIETTGGTQQWCNRRCILILCCHEPARCIYTLRGRCTDCDGALRRTQPSRFLPVHPSTRTTSAIASAVAERKPAARQHDEAPTTDESRPWREPYRVFRTVRTIIRHCHWPTWNKVIGKMLRLDPRVETG